MMALMCTRLPQSLQLLLKGRADMYLPNLP
jgi:hypothetical protein